MLRPGDPLPDGPPLAVDDAGRGELAAIFYTSGTTGFPKGAMTSHENFLSNVETAIRVIDIDRATGPATRNLVSVPLFHVTGCNSQLLLQVGLRGTTVVLPAFDVRAFLRTVAEERIDLLTSVPAIYALALAQPDFADARPHGGDAGSPTAARRSRPRSSAASRRRSRTRGSATGSASPRPPRSPRSCPTSGRPSTPTPSGFAAPVVDLALDEPVDGVGELLVRGPNVVAGYWNKPDATAATFVDGWLHTGDLARIDDDGLVRVVDRAKDMINRGGENVYCVEVENALAGAPGVAEAAVVGVPDDVMGEKVGAVIVPLPGQPIEVAAVLAYLAERLADFKVPQYVALRAEPLPRNPGGKILKRHLRDGTEWGSPLR